MSAFGLYVTHRTGAHVDILPWARFADEDDAVRAARLYGGNFRGNSQISAVCAKAYPDAEPTTTFDEFAVDPERRQRAADA